MKNYSLKFKILDHPTDLKIFIQGKTKQELFKNSLTAMTNSQKAEIEKSKEIKRNIKVESTDLDALLVDFLSEVLYLSQVNKEIYTDVKFSVFKDSAGAGLEGELISFKMV